MAVKSAWAVNLLKVLRTAVSFDSYAGTLIDRECQKRIIKLVRNSIMRQYLTYLRVEKGLRPLTCEAYQRDLSLFAEYLEGTHALPLTAGQAQVAGFLEHLQK